MTTRNVWLYAACFTMLTLVFSLYIQESAVGLWSIPALALAGYLVGLLEVRFEQRERARVKEEGFKDGVNETGALLLRLHAELVAGREVTPARVRQELDELGKRYRAAADRREA